MSVIRLSSPDYPERLNRLHDPPERLFIHGELPDFSRPVLAVVGSRKPSVYGTTILERLLLPVVSAGVHIVSGLALGIDGKAHMAALAARGLTSAVLPSGLDEIYPASHRLLANQIVGSGGALISEYPPSTRAAAYHFPARNRIVAALADAVLVIEAAQKSGTLITAEHALDIGVPVLAVPGAITSPTSAGTNHLIQFGAGLISSATDILSELGFDTSPLPTRRAKDAQGQAILDQLAHSAPASSEQLAAACGLAQGEINRYLTHLELDGAIKAQGGGWVLA